MIKTPFDCTITVSFQFEEGMFYNLTSILHLISCSKILALVSAFGRIETKTSMLKNTLIKDYVLITIIHHINLKQNKTEKECTL